MHGSGGGRIPERTLLAAGGLQNGRLWRPAPASRIVGSRGGRASGWTVFRGRLQNRRFRHRQSPERELWAVGLQNARFLRWAASRTDDFAARTDGFGGRWAAEWAVLEAGGLQNGQSWQGAGSKTGGCGPGKLRHVVLGGQPPEPMVLAAGGLQNGQF